MPKRLMLLAGFALPSAASVEAAPLDIAEGGTNASTQTTNGVAYSDGTKIMTGTALVEAAFASDDRAD